MKLRGLKEKTAYRNSGIKLKQQGFAICNLITPWKEFP